MASRPGEAALRQVPLGQVHRRLQRRVGDVVGLGRVAEIEEEGDHPLDLDLVGAAVAHDRLLHLEGRVLAHREPPRHPGEENDSPDVPEPERALDVRGVEEVLDDDFVGSGASDDGGDSLVDEVELLGEGEARGGADDAVLDEPVAVAVGVENPESRRLRAGVDAEDPHGAFSLLPRAGVTSTSPLRSLSPRCRSSPRRSSGRRAPRGPP